ncbi:protein TolQ [Gammaproteobacteria bacterium]|mgnify:FL=1|jgi:biopolymer transport protein TolQ|nr:protein TolQ [Gammaproteobacteria bacterium]MDA9561247.1 protein TolQ [Gammaproteobacteria bacterium]MDA9805622.1 protein TolQ [Gammaproteobacteria bacterium]MDA9815162.1 protein TolQ [Gammaproteobacteria bacterium]MDB4849288.1 protein TolQ [Gammaproteobacteria bacterium]
MNDISVLNLFLEAGMVVKTVMVILLIASLLTWIVIVERYNFYKKIRVINDSFLERFWSGEDLNLLYSEIKTETVPVYGALSVFKNSFKEFLQIDQTNEITELDLEGINRSMRVAIASDEEEMNKHLAFLANVGSVSPYIGLLGTVWGIMTSFQGLSDATQATINAVAPGISEALVATAMGLFAAIPAVIAFNKYTSELETISQSTLIFSEELASIFYKQSIKK